jgi:uncharacterized protein
MKKQTLALGPKHLYSKFSVARLTQLSAIVALFSSPITYANDLILSGVVDGPLTGGLPKAIQVYVANDIADLSQCGLGSANNGGGSDGQEFTFPAVSATTGDYLYIASESAFFSAFFGFSPNFVSGAANINGDDAIELFCDETVVDVFGDINTDGSGQDWEYLDGWASRVPESGPDGSTFTQSSWTFSGKNALDGESNNSTAAKPFPLMGGAGETGGGDNDGNDGGNTGGETGGDAISGACFNCPDLSKIADASTFDDASYYADVITAVANGQSANDLRSSISMVISNNHKNLTYSEVWTALTKTDEDPANTDNVILFYKGTSLAKNANGSGTQSSNPDNWNREHVWAKSHGFPSTSQEGYTDIHHLRPTDISVNASRGNLDFDKSDSPLSESPINRVDGDSFEPRDDVKGDVARMIFYMDTRYQGLGSDTTPDLEVVDRLTSTGEAALGRLCRLLEWHNGDPVNGFEENRNNVIYEFQGNRNPFIDHPEWVTSIYGTSTCTDDGDTSGGDNGGDTGGDNGGDAGDDTGGNSGELIISEYIEGSSNNKAIELFNPTVNDIDLGAESYKLARFSNGGTSGSDISLSGTILANSTYVIAHSSASAALLNLADQTTGSLSHNGDDAYVLYKNNTVIDSFGRVGEDPGSYWGSDSFKTQNNTLARNADVTTGDTLVDDAFEPSNQWTGSRNDDFSGLGTHTIINPEIYISEYVEGSSNNKAIELYNPGFSDVNLSTDNYQLARFSNGSITPTTADLTGTIPAGGVIVFANASASDEIKNTAQTLGLISHNGDDAYVLYKNGEVIDSFGRVGEDPGAEWGSDIQSTKDNTLVRKSSVTQGDTIIDDAFEPSIEWDGYANDTFEFLGNHQNSPDDNTGGDNIDIGECEANATLISAIQGREFESPLLGESHIIEGVVTATFPKLNGFFIQEEATDNDTDSLTSEGMFVSSADLPTIGSVVRVKGDIVEYFGKTQLTATEGFIDCGSATVDAVSLTLPFANAQQVEALEGMLVTIDTPLTVSNTFTLGKYGELTLSNGLLHIPTNIYAPNSAQALALQAENALNKVLLDDVVNGSYPDDIIYPTGGLSADNTVRLGDQVTSLVGILDYSFSNYRVLPTQAPTFDHVNARTNTPLVNEGNVKIASLNVLNLFNGDGQSGGFPTARGADTPEEFERQLAKTVSAIISIDADIIGLMEIENDGVGANSTLNELVNSLNNVAGEGMYAFVNTGGPIGTDAIAVAFLYQPSKVSLIGDALVNTNEIFNRPPLAQTFSLNSNNQTITVVANHFKSKGGCRSASGEDTDQGDGQACFNARRVAQASELVNWVNTNEQLSQQTDVLVIGDLNAYAKEDPIQQFTNNGYINLISTFGGDYAYSYSFGGEVGYLDHALASASLAEKAVDAVEWHINADEPAFLDYNTENKSDLQQETLYSDDAFRMSDHDPVVATFNLTAAAVIGDWDGDGDVDVNDVRAFMRAIQSGVEIDLSFDLNTDGSVTILDARTMMTMCTRSRCAP